LHFSFPFHNIAIAHDDPQLASISSLHAAGVVHGFISPETVSITDEKYLVLCDCEHHEHDQMYVYTAPEVILGWTHGSAVDLWGFGIVLYYMLIGFVSPFYLRQSTSQ